MKEGNGNQAQVKNFYENISPCSKVRYVVYIFYNNSKRSM